jgi:hypothetical protein
MLPTSSLCDGRTGPTEKDHAGGHDQDEGRGEVAIRTALPDDGARIDQAPGDQPRARRSSSVADIADGDQSTD